MSVLVTGSRGMIGSRVMQILEERGHKPVGYDIVDGFDVCDRGLLADYMMGLRPRAVVHLAAIPHPAAGRTWAEYWRLNVCGTENVAYAAEAAGVTRLVYASSTTYYGAERGFPLGGERLEVLSPNAIQRYLEAVLPEMDVWPRASIYYMVSKIAAEAALAAYGLAERLHVRIFRLCPCSQAGTSYSWGLRVRLDTAARRLAEAVISPCESFYRIENLCEPDVAKVGG